MQLFQFSQDVQAWLALGILVLMFVAFLKESFPTEVVAIVAAASMILLGLLPIDKATAVLSNTAPWTIALMFIVMGALVRTGALDALTTLAEAQAKHHPRRAIGLMIGFVALASAVVSNTPVVVVMIPVFVQLARSLDISASKLLIPLSYAAILGGTLTLIGTSTNLLVDGVARAEGLAGFTIFEVTPLGVILVIWGMIYLRFVAPLLLPHRDSMANLLSDKTKMKFFTEVVIPPDSTLIDRDVIGVELFKRDGVRLVDVIRGDASLRRNLQEVSLKVGDRVVLRTQIAELLSLQRDKNLKRVDQVSAVETTTVEALITPECKMVGRSLGQLRLRRRFGVYPLAVHRRSQNIGKQLDDLVVQVGDTLLLEGGSEDIQRLAQEMELVDLSRPAARAYRRGHAPVAVGALLGVVGLAALGVAPIFLLTVLAVAAVLLLRAIDADEAFSFVDGRLLTLIFAMLAVGAALQASGAVELIVNMLVPLLSQMPPILMIWMLYLITSVLTELVSNNAVAVVITPIAIALAQALGVDPRPLVVAVMVAASASFATPIGYQTKMMVYGPGGYRFTDFMRVGIPLNLSIGLISSVMIPLIWPL